MGVNHELNISELMIDQNGDVTLLANPDYESQSSYNFTPRFRSNAIGEISKLLCERSEKSLMKSYDQILMDSNKIAETERSFKDVNECLQIKTKFRLIPKYAD